MSAYREMIIEHYKNPMNHFKMVNPSIEVYDSNPVCGDEVTVYLRIKDNKIEEISFQGNGCAISQAATSILTDELVGLTLDEVNEFGQEKIRELLGVPLSPVRLKCALLGIKVIQSAILKYQAENA
jgi:nitrogen fixation protein NifU and related proteins